MHITKIKGEAGTQSLVPPFYASHSLGVTVDAEVGVTVDAGGQ